jgi:capsular polysaccharide export protein
MITTFICLDPRKKKKEKILGALNSIGDIRFLRFPKMSFKGFPESKDRAQKAYDQAVRPAKISALAWTQRKLYEYQYNGSRHYFIAHKHVVAVAWNGLNGSRHAFMSGALDAGVKRLYFEEAPLPSRITVDPVGVNYMNSLPREIAPYKAWLSASNISHDNWRLQGRKITQRDPIKPPKEPAHFVPPLTEPFLFVPLQVPNDSQLRLYGGLFSTVDSFIHAILKAAKNLPPGWHIRMKAHPSSRESVEQHFSKKNNVAVFLDNTTDTFKQVAASKGVMTVNSSVGLEAMFFDKPVITTGKCFWGIEGVAISAPTEEAIAHLLADPEKLRFDVHARNAFMNFLTEIYYPEMVLNANNVMVCNTKELDKLKIRLNGPDTFGFWKQQVES